MHRIWEGGQSRCSRREVIAEIILFILPIHVHSKAGLFDPEDRIERVVFPRRSDRRVGDLLAVTAFID